MSFPYFISPEQAMRQRGELARKGIARGRSVVALDVGGRHPRRQSAPAGVPTNHRPCVGGPEASDSSGSTGSESAKGSAEK